MKTILRILADIALLPVSGCIFPGNRDRSADADGSNIQPQSGESKEVTDKMNAVTGLNSEKHPAATNLNQ